MDWHTFCEQNTLILSFLGIGGILFLARQLSAHATKKRVHASAFSIALGLAAAYLGGALKHGSCGIADLAAFSGIGVLGGSALRDFTVVAVSYGADLKEFGRHKTETAIALFVGVSLSYFSALVISLAFGYRDAKELAVIASGAVTFIVGPVTASALGVTSNVVAISIAAGVIKSVLIMLLTPLAVKKLKLDSPKAVMLYGAMLGSTSGVTAGLMAVDERLVPYGTLSTSFYMGVGCLICPTILYSLTVLMVCPQP